MLKKIFAPGNDSFCTNLALLILRLWLGLTLPLAHGIDKIKGFSGMASDFIDPFGIGKSATLGLVVFAEVFASVMLAVGLLTRFQAFVLVVNMGYAFFVAHKATLGGEHGGELAFIYLAGFVALLISGPGAFSVDQALFKRKG